METSLVHFLEQCYLCNALVTIRGNELIIFLCITLYSDDKYILEFLPLLNVILGNITSLLQLRSMSNNTLEATNE